MSSEPEWTTSTNNITTDDVHPHPSSETERRLNESVRTTGSFQSNPPSLSWVPHPSSLPITVTVNRSISSSENHQQYDNKTDTHSYLVQIFSNRVVLCISSSTDPSNDCETNKSSSTGRHGRIANWLYVQRTPILFGGERNIRTTTTTSQPPPRPPPKTLDVQITHLLGSNRDDAILWVYAKRIAHGIVPYEIPILLGLSSSVLSSASWVDEKKTLEMHVDSIVSLYRDAIQKAR